MTFIPEIKRTILLNKKIMGREIASALSSISHSFGAYTQRLASDIDGSRTFDIGILKNNKYPQTGLIVKAVSTSLDSLGLETGIVFDKIYCSGDKLMVVNHRWEDQVAHYYAPYDEKKVIQAVDSLKKGLAIKLDSVS